jgi:hypothetical protein
VTLTEFTTGAATVIVADAVFVVSAALVAVIVAVPALADAVNSPAELTEPEDVLHVTDLFVTVPCTDAVSCSVPLVMTDAVDGETVTEFTTGTATVIVADAVFVVSATLVAVIVAVPALADAVNSPAELTEPEDVLHVTDLFVTVPCTDAVSCSVPLVMTDAVDGETVTEFTTGTATVIVADAVFVVSATLVAVMVAVPEVAGAVNRPAELIVPDEVVHVTALVDGLPPTVAVS